MALVPCRPIKNVQIHLGKERTIVGDPRPSRLVEALGRNAKPDPTVEGDDDVDQARMTESEKEEKGGGEGGGGEAEADKA
jgi:hypothetical protein